MGMSVSTLMTRLGLEWVKAALLAGACLITTSAQALSEELQKCTNYQTHYVKGIPMYKSAQGEGGRNAISDGLVPLPAFYLKDAADWEQWTAHEYYPRPLPSLKIQELPSDLIRSYYDGSAGIFARVTMWEKNKSRDQPFAISGKGSGGCQLVSRGAEKVIAIGGVVMSLEESTADDRYIARNGNSVYPSRGEALIKIGSYDHGRPTRFLLLKKIKSLTCDYQDIDFIKDRPDTECNKFLVSARVIETSTKIPFKPNEFREENLGEAYVRVFHHRKYEKWAKIFSRDSWWEKLIDPVIQFGRNR
jgi:hypothetical protein